MAQNKLKAYVEQLKIGSYVKTHRKLTLRLNYRKGLADELQQDDDIALTKKLQTIESYYLEEIEVYEKRLKGITKADEKRERVITSFDMRQYWQKRKYQTTLKRQNHPDFEKLMESFTQQQAQDREAFIEKVTLKYPHQELTEQDIAELNKSIKKRQKIRDQRIDNTNAQHEKKHQRYLKFVEKNIVYINKQEKRAADISKAIETYNQEKLTKDQMRVNILKERIQSVNQLSRLSVKAKSKKLEKLIEQLSLIEITHETIKDPSIHLNISNLKMFFGGVKAVNDLTFHVKKGEIFGLIGPNGAGKTTVFNCLTQFYKATSGQMVFRNKEDKIVDLYQRKTHDMITEGIARSFQNVELIWELTVLDNLLVASHSLLVTNYLDHMTHTKKLAREESVLRTKGMQVLKNLGIESYAFRSPYGLPYGILKKVELARTLMTDPSLIILDEPAAGLNDAETKDLAKMIKKINKDYGITIFLVEHDMGLVMSICDRVCAISFGRMIGLGTPKEIQENPEVRKAYLGDDSDA